MTVAGQPRSLTEVRAGCASTWRNVGVSMSVLRRALPVLELPVASAASTLDPPAVAQRHRPWVTAKELRTAASCNGHRVVPTRGILNR